MNMMRIPYKTLSKAIARRLIEAGLQEDHGQIEAGIMADADLLEVPSHGVRMLPGLLQAIADGRVNAVPNIHTERELGATCVINCDNGPGRYSSVQAMTAAITRAQNFGVGVCLAKNTSHWGRAHAYASLAAQAGCIGICTTNAMPTMAIWGSKTRTIGNNPLAIGIPHTSTTNTTNTTSTNNNDNNEPIVLDMAMSQAAVGKVATWLREGHTPPDNWGLDAQGNPSNNAQDILNGAVVPMGEHKGAALALMMELMTAALASAAFSHQLHALDQSGVDPNATKLFIAMNVQAFSDPDAFAESVSYYLSHLNQNAAPFQYPSERGWKAKRNNMIEGVPLHQEIVEQLQAVNVGLSGL